MAYISATVTCADCGTNFPSLQAWQHRNKGPFCPACYTNRVSPLKVAQNFWQPKSSFIHQGNTMPPYRSSSYPAKGTARIWWDPAVLAYRVVTPLNQSFVDALKALIPASDRVWDPDAKQWTIHEAYLDATAKFCEQVFGNKPTILDRKAAEKQAAAQPSQNGHSPSVTRGQPLDVTIVSFFRLLSYEAARTAYRKAMMETHPDTVGGDAAKASDLNSAWARIEKELFGK